MISDIICSLSDFEGYLSFVDRTLPNLQFVVWYQSYRERFLNLPPPGQAFSPPPDAHTPYYPPPSPIASSTASITLYQALKTPPASPSLLPPTSPFSIAPSISSLHQPMRTEVSRVIATFLLPRSPKALICLTDTMKESIISDLQSTTHPDAFAFANEAALSALRASLPHFLAQSVRVTNRPKQLFWFTVGIASLGLGFSLFFITLLIAQLDSHLTNWGMRGLRLISVPFIGYGVQIITMASYGHCGKIARRGHVQLRPWELEHASEEEEKTWWNGLGSVPDTLDDTDVGSAATVVDDFEDEKGSLPGPSLTLRGRRKARRVRDKLLSELTILDLPTSLSRMTTRGPESSSPITISFIRSTTVAVDSDWTLSLPSPAPAIIKGLPTPPGPTIDVGLANTGPERVDLPEITLTADQKLPSSIHSVHSYAQGNQFNVIPTPKSVSSRNTSPSSQRTLRNPPVFGPEKVVLDIRVLALYTRIKIRTTAALFISTLVRLVLLRIVDRYVLTYLV